MVPEVRKNSTRYYVSIDGCKIIAFVSAFILALTLSSCAGLPAGDPVIEAKKVMAGADPFMGDWQGGWRLGDGTESGPLVAQVIALGKGEYRAVFFDEFDVRAEPKASLDGRLEDAKVLFTGQADSEIGNLDVQAVIQGDKLSGSFKGQGESGTFELTKTIRLSPTLGEKPPKGAIVVVDGKDFKKWKHPNKKEGEDAVKWELVDGAIRVKPGTGSIITRKQFTDVRLHIEFRTPFMPKARGQGRGNSGVYLQGRYEVQVLDSYGLKGRDDECGGIYSVAQPRVNMCAPPMQWQTYDITFRAPRFDGAGKKVSNPTLTVVHNGVKIHDKTEARGPTTASLGGKATEPAGIYLQDHGNPVQYRNIWLVEL
jgi:hypothetical protein